MNSTKELAKEKIKPLENLFRLFNENNDKIEELTMINRGLVNHICQIAETLILLHGINFTEWNNILTYKGDSNE